MRLSGETRFDLGWLTQSLIQKVEELLDLSEWSLATRVEIDEPIAVTLQRSPFDFRNLPGRRVAATASGPTSSLTIPLRLQSILSLAAAKKSRAAGANLPKRREASSSRSFSSSSLRHLAAVTQPRLPARFWSRSLHSLPCPDSRISPKVTLLVVREHGRTIPLTHIG